MVNSHNTKLFTKLSVDADKDVKISLIFEDKILSFTTYKQGINNFAFKNCSKTARLVDSSSQETAVVKRIELDYYEY